MPIEKYSLILGSQSPRRSEIFSHLGISFSTYPPRVDEPAWKGEEPKSYCEYLARIKGEVIVNKLNKKDWVLVTADTIVEVDGKVLGKPKNRDDAQKMLLAMSGKKHRVLTSYQVLFEEESSWVETVESLVVFRKIDKDTLEIYLSKGEFLDKAGAYGIQGATTPFVQEIHGSYSNIVGFPMDYLVAFFKKKWGVNWRNHFDKD